MRLTVHVSLFFGMHLSLASACGSTPDEANHTGCLSDADCFAHEVCSEFGWCEPQLAPEASCIDGVSRHGAPCSNEEDPSTDEPVLDESEDTNPTMEDDSPGAGEDEPFIESGTDSSEPIEDSQPVEEDIVDDSSSTEAEETSTDPGDDAEFTGSGTDDEALDPEDPTCQSLPALTTLTQPHAMNVNNALIQGNVNDRWLASEQDVAVCADDAVFMSIPGVSWQTTHVAAAWTGSDDLNVNFWGPTLSASGYAIASTQAEGFELGTYVIPGNPGSENLVQFSVENSSGVTQPDALAAHLQVRTGSDCWTDGDCAAGTNCVLPHWNPHQSAGPDAQPWQSMAFGACSQPLSPLCDNPDSDQGYNASMSTAHRGMPVNGEARSCQFDEDWYDLSVSAQDQQFNDFDGHWTFSFTNKASTPGTYTLYFIRANGYVVGTKGFVDLQPGATGSTTIRYLWEGANVFMRVVKLDAGEGLYDFDVSIQNAGCTSDATCRADSSAGPMARNQCITGTCEPCAYDYCTEDELTPVTCPANSTDPACRLYAPAH